MLLKSFNFVKFPFKNLLYNITKKSFCSCDKTLELLRLMAARKRGTYDPEIPRHVRLKRSRQKSGLESKPSSVLSMVTISNGFGYSPKAVVIQSEHRHYLIGCGEGAQRILMELSTRFVKVNQVFLTNSSWEQRGGLVGLSISLESAACDELNIHAPFDVTTWLDASRTKEAFQHLKINQQKYRDKERYEDETFFIEQIPLDLDHNGNRQQDQRLNLANRCSYIFDSKPLPEKLSIEKCILLNVPSNHLRSRLKDGLSITLEDGRIVKPEDVLVPSHPNIRILVLDVDADEEIASEQLNKVLNSLNGNIPDYVLHFSNATIQKSQMYKKFCLDHFNETRHLYLNEELDNIESDGIYKMQCRLNSVDNQLFPLFPAQIKALSQKIENTDEDDLKTKSPQSADTLNPSSEIEDLSKPFPLGASNQLENEAKTALSINIRNHTYQMIDEFKLHLPSHVSDGTNEVEKEVDSVQKEMSFPNVVFLGTGSACPSKVRNVTSNLLRINQNQSILLDCGEGTKTQMVRLFGKDEYVSILKSMKVIFISHMHPDHHQGIISLINDWLAIKYSTNCNKMKLAIVCPANLCYLLKTCRLNKCFDYEVEFNEQFDSSEDSLVIHMCRNRQLTRHLRNCSLSDYSDGQTVNDVSSDDALNDQRTLEFQKFYNEQLGFEYLITIPVDHIYDSYGIVIQHKDNWKFVYSGDCRPSDRLVQAGMNADLLVHEATLEDGMETEAKLVKHCTFGEAVQVSRRMKAKHTILSHFSQRYSKVPSIDIENLEDQNIAITFDNTIIPFQRLDDLRSLAHPLRQAFTSEFEVLQQRRLRSAFLKNQHVFSERCSSSNNETSDQTNQNNKVNEINSALIEEKFEK